MGSSYRLTPGDLGIPNKTATGGSSQVSKSGEQVPYSEMAMARYKPFSRGISVLKTGILGHNCNHKWKVNGMSNMNRIPLLMGV